MAQVTHMAQNRWLSSWSQGKRCFSGTRRCTMLYEHDEAGVNRVKCLYAKTEKRIVCSILQNKSLILSQNTYNVVRCLTKLIITPTGLHERTLLYRTRKSDVQCFCGEKNCLFKAKTQLVILHFLKRKGGGGKRLICFVVVALRSCMRIRLCNIHVYKQTSDKTKFRWD